MEIDIFFDSKNSAAVRKHKNLLKKAVEYGLGIHAAGQGRVCLVLTGPVEMRGINKKFLKSSKNTDVIAFNYNPEQTGDKHIRELSSGILPFGDIYISYEQAQKQADELKHTLLTELLILSAHGALHLSGMDDSNKIEKSKMDEKTDLIVRRILSK